MKYIDGSLSASLRVNEDLAVRGSLLDGATVTRGCHLLVHGDLQGAVVVEQGAQLTIGGTFSALVDRNSGTIAVAGVLALPMELLPGTVIVAANSAVTLNGTTAFLTADGELHRIEDVLDIRLTNSIALQWNPETATFTPTASDHFEQLVRLVWPNKSL